MSNTRGASRWVFTISRFPAKWALSATAAPHVQGPHYVAQAVAVSSHLWAALSTSKEHSTDNWPKINSSWHTCRHAFRTPYNPLFFSVNTVSCSIPNPERSRQVPRPLIRGRDLSLLATYRLLPLTYWNRSQNTPRVVRRGLYQYLSDSLPLRIP